MLPIEAKRCFKSQWGSQNRNGAGRRSRRLRRPPGAGIGPKQCPGPKDGSGENELSSARLYESRHQGTEANHGLVLHRRPSCKDGNSPMNGPGHA